MDSYFEVKAIPDPELLQSAVMGQLMQTLHGCLTDFDGRVGVSFPGYGQARTLGGILRLHGSSPDMDQLKFQLESKPTATSYGLLTDVAPVPSKLKGHALFQRKHVKGKSNIRRLEKYHRANGTWTADREKAIAEKYQQAVTYPHIVLKSHSTKQPKFLLFVEKKNVVQPISGEFNAYGLSKTATVPWF